MWALALQIFCLLPISESPEIRKISFACSNFHKMWAKTPNSGNNCQRQFFHLAILSSSSFFFLPRIFVPPSEKPGGICGQLALPQSCWGSVGLPGWGRAPCAGPSHLAQSDLAPGRLVFLTQGKSMSAFITTSVGKRVRSPFESVHMPSAAPGSLPLHHFEHTKIY